MNPSTSADPDDRFIVVHLPQSDHFIVCGHTYLDGNLNANGTLTVQFNGKTENGELKGLFENKEDAINYANQLLINKDNNISNGVGAIKEEEVNSLAPIALDPSSLYISVSSDDLRGLSDRMTEMEKRLMRQEDLLLNTFAKLHNAHDLIVKQQESIQKLTELVQQSNPGLPRTETLSVSTSVPQVQNLPKVTNSNSQMTPVQLVHTTISKTIKALENTVENLTKSNSNSSGILSIPTTSTATAVIKTEPMEVTLPIGATASTSSDLQNVLSLGSQDSSFSSSKPQFKYFTEAECELIWKAVYPSFLNFAHRLNCQLFTMPEFLKPLEERDAEKVAEFRKIIGYYSRPKTLAEELKNYNECVAEINEKVPKKPIEDRKPIDLSQVCLPVIRRGRGRPRKYFTPYTVPGSDNTTS